MENKEEQESPTQEEEVVKLDLDKVRALIPQYSHEKLCEMIVCYRYFGFSQEIAVMCMEELSLRRITGSDFQFETYIEDSLKKLPPLNFNMPDLRTTLQQMVKGKK